MRRFAGRFREADRAEVARELADTTRRRLELISRDGGSVDSAAWNQFLSKIYNDLGSVEGADGGDAIGVRLRSTTLRAENVGQRPDDPEALYQLACGYLDLAGDLLRAGRGSGALICFRLSRFLLEHRVPPRFYRREGLVDLCLREEHRLDPPVEAVEVVPPGAVWKYDDRRDFPGDGWTGPDFDDSGWKSGPAELGYGDGDEATLLEYGPDPGRKNLTAWFRHRFEATDPAALDPLRISLLCDDGARVFLNGREIIRHGLPDGPISPTTVANLTVSGLDETLHRVFTFRTDELPLRAGANQLAVEVDGEERPALEVLRHREQYQATAEDPEKSEYFVKVEWLDTLPREKAFHEIGLFGNQNSVCQPVAASWRHTVERLKTVFPSWDAKSRKTDCPEAKTAVSL